MPSASFDGWEIYVMLIPLSGDSEAQWNNEDLSHFEVAWLAQSPGRWLLSMEKLSKPPPPLQAQAFIYWIIKETVYPSEDYFSY